MKKVLETLLEVLVTDPKSIKVEEEKTDNNILLRVSVAKEDMGRVIGKDGKIIQALRSLLKVKAIKDGKRVEISLVEPAVA